jgi:hypothetical protein
MISLVKFSQSKRCLIQHLNRKSHPGMLINEIKNTDRIILRREKEDTIAWLAFTRLNYPMNFGLNMWVVKCSIGIELHCWTWNHSYLHINPDRAYDYSQDKDNDIFLEHDFSEEPKMRTESKNKEPTYWSKHHQYLLELKKKKKW